MKFVVKPLDDEAPSGECLGRNWRVILEKSAAAGCIGVPQSGTGHPSRRHCVGGGGVWEGCVFEGWVLDGLAFVGGLAPGGSFNSGRANLIRVALAAFDDPKASAGTGRFSCQLVSSNPWRSCNGSSR